MDEGRVSVDRHKRVQLKPALLRALSVQPLGRAARCDSSGRLKIDRGRQRPAAVLPGSGFGHEATLTGQTAERHVLVVRGSEEHACEVDSIWRHARSVRLRDVQCGRARPLLRPAGAAARYGVRPTASVGRWRSPPVQ
jgi:hypothetical protein